jgi:hypothetical protein
MGTTMRGLPTPGGSARDRWAEQRRAVRVQRLAMSATLAHAFHVKHVVLAEKDDDARHSSDGESRHLGWPRRRRHVRRHPLTAIRPAVAFPGSLRLRHGDREMPTRRAGWRWRSCRTHVCDGGA